MRNFGVIQEPSRTLPVSGEFDVVVVGGGMAGVAAAVAAARCSARVCLVERYCGLGGLATLGNVTIWLPLCDGRGNQVIAGLGEELLKLSVAHLRKDYPTARFRRVPECWTKEGNPQKRAGQRYQLGFNPADYMLSLEKLVVDSGVTLLYDTRLCSVRGEENRLSHVIIENKSGRSALAARTFIDATGDADLCFLAGEKTFSVESNVPAGWYYTLTSGQLKLHQLSAPYHPHALAEEVEGPFFRGDDAAQVTNHLVQTRSLIRQKLARMRAESPQEDPQVLMPAMTACFRMTRRLATDFSLTNDHMHQWFDDAIGLTGDWRKAGPVYAIPFRCLQPMQSSNLLVAGRCISVDNTIWDALRAIPPCVVTGEAAGTAAALAASHTNGSIKMLDFNILKDQLVSQGVLLDPGLVEQANDAPKDKADACDC